MYDHTHGIILFPVEHEFNWRMNVKKIIITILTISAFFALNVLIAGVSEEKSVNKDDNFLRENANIKNGDLRLALANLRKQFDLEKTMIHDLYKEKMETLKNARQDEIKSLKNDFASRRELLFKKYPPKTRKKPLMANPNSEAIDTAPTNITPDKKKKPTGKKKVRKP